MYGTTCLASKYLTWHCKRHCVCFNTPARTAGVETGAAAAEPDGPGGPLCPTLQGAHKQQHFF